MHTTEAEMSWLYTDSICRIYIDVNALNSYQYLSHTSNTPNYVHYRARVYFVCFDSCMASKNLL